MERSNGYITTHLSQEGAQSPFSVAGQLLTTAIDDHAAAESQMLEEVLTTILTEIYNHFDQIIDNKATDPVEQPLKSAIKEYLATAINDFEGQKAELAKIKEKYEDVEIKEET